MPTSFIQPVFSLGLKSSFCSCHKFSPFPLFQLHPTQGGFLLWVVGWSLRWVQPIADLTTESGESYVNSYPVLLTNLESFFFRFWTVSNSLIGTVPNNNGLSSIIAYERSGEEFKEWLSDTDLLNSVLALPIIESYSWWITVSLFVVRRGVRPVINN